MREGSLEAPTRHPLEWQAEDFTDPKKLDDELRRVFDICHGCRRCFNLCDSFPRLFDLIDASPTMEVDGVDSKDFKAVVDDCTLCDMCFMTKCPYVPPHEFNLDFPHLMLRYRAAEFQGGKVGFAEKQLAKTDRNGKLARPVAPLANWASKTSNKPVRTLLEKTAHIDRHAKLPTYHSRTFEAQAKSKPLSANAQAPAFGRKAVIYATCFANYNRPGLGLAARALLNHNGVETHVVYPACCGMPKLEQGDLQAVADAAAEVSAALVPWIDKGYDVISLVPSCTLMLKFEWKLISPDAPDIEKLAAATYDISEYIVDIAKKEGLTPGLKQLDGGVSLHLACHARAQNMGPKAAEMLRLIPESDIQVIERCSGHGGSWGIMKDHFETALKVGKPVARSALKGAKKHLSSECPLAGDHITQGMERLDDSAAPAHATHPIELMAMAYGLDCQT